MKLLDAKDKALRGTEFGELYEALGELDRGPFKEWWLTHQRVPNLPSRKAAVVQSPTGEVCKNCQGPNLVRTGTCVTCQDCGTNEGCG